MTGTDIESGDSVLPGWFEGERQNLIIAGLLWAAAATIYWLGAGSLAETGDLAVGALFVVLAVYNFARAAFADPSGLHKQENSCRWSWGWQGP
ncbi:hypothetical protein GGP65_003292 [Salinibacter ruber]|jgi:hypothetical protein|uniref:Uncharacterized protein n=1 Tax=Salinibacter ruber TaxID=146919 RepID=A0AAW5PD21_9BACT|nr:hypothetical protein [Salinibacter ruber]MCS3665648.1 hypothetical protein [Salinibacter ruber]MCS4159349.1 hypothetical protein [Salinibacter ruber]MCS4223815.1 hypothetical protein [Salinibacter ruber]